MKILVIDVGGTFIKYGLIDESLTITKKNKKETIKTSLDAYLNQISSIYDEFKQQVSGVAFSMPGFVNSNTGEIKFGGALNDIVHNINIKDVLEKKLQTKVAVSNDADCAALAELTFGSLKDCNDAAVYIIGTGIGGSLIHNKEIIQGKNFASGEFSFMIIDNNDIQFNNLLAFKTGAHALTNMVAQKIKRKSITGEQVFELVKQNNKEVIACLKQYCRNIAVSLCNIQCIYDPEKIAIGGGISQQEILIDYINDAIQEIEEQNKNLIPRPNIVCCHFCNDANLIGAYSNFLKISEK